MLDGIVREVDILVVSNEIILKRCPQCRIVKEREPNFGKNITTGDGFESWCKECKYKDKQNHKVEYIDWVKSVYREAVLGHTLNELTCLKCYDPCYYKIEWHHVIPSTKEFEVSFAIKSGWKKDRVLPEIRKCAPLCGNCHTIYHRYADLVKFPVNLETLTEYLITAEPVVIWRMDAALNAKRKTPKLIT